MLLSSMHLITHAADTGDTSGGLGGGKGDLSGITIARYYGGIKVSIMTIPKSSEWTDPYNQGYIPREKLNPVFASEQDTFMISINVPGQPDGHIYGANYLNNMGEVKKVDSHYYWEGSVNNLEIPVVEGATWEDNVIRDKIKKLFAYNPMSGQDSNYVRTALGTVDTDLPENDNPTNKANNSKLFMAIAQLLANTKGGDSLAAKVAKGEIDLSSNDYVLVWEPVNGVSIGGSRADSYMATPYAMAVKASGIQFKDVNDWSVVNFLTGTRTAEAAILIGKYGVSENSKMQYINGSSGDLATIAKMWYEGPVNEARVKATKDSMLWGFGTLKISSSGASTPSSQIELGVIDIGPVKSYESSSSYTKFSNHITMEQRIFGDSGLDITYSPKNPGEELSDDTSKEILANRLEKDFEKGGTEPEIASLFYADKLQKNFASGNTHNGATQVDKSFIDALLDNKGSPREDYMNSATFRKLFETYVGDVPNKAGSDVTEIDGVGRLSDILSTALFGKHILGRFSKDTAPAEGFYTGAPATRSGYKPDYAYERLTIPERNIGLVYAAVYHLNFSDTNKNPVVMTGFYGWWDTLMAEIGKLIIANKYSSDC